MSLSMRLAIFLVVFMALIPSITARAAITHNISARAALRVLIVGDSITQGHEGDYTWRYRLWEWFNTQGVTVDFVGPWTGTRPQDNYTAAQPPLQGATADCPTCGVIANGGYALDIDSNFDSDHFGAWGRAVAQDKGSIKSIVSTYQPDLVLVLLGFNDLGFAVSDAAGTLDSMKTLVAEARVAKSDIKIGLGNIPQRIALTGRVDLPVNTDRYNKLLAAAIPTWSTTMSPIAPVLIRENYRCENSSCPAGYDGLHPNALGEYQIAQAFSRALVSSFSIGTSQLVIPTTIPARPVEVPANVKAVTSLMGVTVTWDYVYGATGYHINVRTPGSQFGTPSLQNPNRYDSVFTTGGKTYEYRVRMVYGDHVKSDWSPTVSAVAHSQASKSAGNGVSDTTGIRNGNLIYVLLLPISVACIYISGKLALKTSHGSRLFATLRKYT